MNKIAFWIIAFSWISWSANSQDIYEVNQGTVKWVSDAPLEHIEAESKELKGLMDVSKNTFAFTIEIETFEGLNSELQREHFYENYMQTDLFPKASFNGKLIDAFDPNASQQMVRAKGKLNIHGVAMDRIIPIQITKKNGAFEVSCTFNVLLKDHGILIPKIVHQKISETIQVSLKGEMKKK